MEQTINTMTERERQLDDIKMIATPGDWKKDMEAAITKLRCIRSDLRRV